LLNLQLRPAGLGAVVAERSDSKDCDKRRCQVEVVVGLSFGFISKNYFYKLFNSALKFKVKYFSLLLYSKPNELY